MLFFVVFKQFVEVGDFCESIFMVVQSLTFNQKSRGRCAGIIIQFAAIEGTSVTTTFTRSFKCDYAVQRTIAPVFFSAVGCIHFLFVPVNCRLPLLLFCCC